MNLIHEWPVEPRSLSIRLGSHQQEPSAFCSVCDRELLSTTQHHELGRPGRAPSGPEVARALEYIPDVVEPSVRMPGVDVRQIRQAQPRFVKKDERVDLFIRHRPGG